MLGYRIRIGCGRAGATLVVSLALVTGGCGADGGGDGSDVNGLQGGGRAAGAVTTATAVDSLYGEWRLVELQSMDDAIGVVQPDSGRSYTLTIARDGLLGMHLDCNRASATAAITEGSKAGSGQLRVGPVALTRAYCGEGSLDTRVAQEMEHVVSYLIRDGRLHLALMADGGIQVWER